MEAFASTEPRCVSGLRTEPEPAGSEKIYDLEAVLENVHRLFVKAVESSRHNAEYCQFDRQDCNYLYIPIKYQFRRGW